MTKWEIGDDGWPISPLHPANLVTAEEMRERRFTQEMRACRSAVEAGNLVLLERTIRVCDEYCRPLPLWAAAAVISMVRNSLGNGVKRRGRTGNPVSEYRQNQIHFARHSEVEYLREYWSDLLDESQEPLFKQKPSLEEAFDEASKSLKGRPEGGSAETIRKSYFFVEREVRRGRSGLFVHR